MHNELGQSLSGSIGIESFVDNSMTAGLPHVKVTKSLKLR